MEMFISEISPEESHVGECSNSLFVGIGAFFGGMTATIIITLVICITFKVKNMSASIITHLLDNISDIYR